MNVKKWSEGNLYLKNKKAYFDYEILDEIVCWMVLFGYEVKSIRQGHVSFAGSYVVIQNGELYVKDLQITPYKFASSVQDINPTRMRKLLASRKEIDKLDSKMSEKWFTLVPICITTKWGRIKLIVWVWKWKKVYDKKETIKQRDVERDLRRRTYK